MGAAPELLVRLAKTSQIHVVAQLLRYSFWLSLMSGTGIVP